MSHRLSAPIGRPRAPAAPDLERIGERRVRATAGDVREALSRLWRGIAEAFHEPAAWLR
jgi:hypothetical protein